MTSVQLNHKMPNNNNLPPLPSVLAIAAISLVLGVTNPDRAAYANYAAWNLKKSVCQAKPVMSELPVCPFVESVPYRWMAGVIDPYTQRKNYLLFSLYTTEVPGWKHTSLGIAGHFFPLP